MHASYAFLFVIHHSKILPKDSINPALHDDACMHRMLAVCIPSLPDFTKDIVSSTGTIKRVLVACHPEFYARRRRSVDGQTKIFENRKTFRTVVLSTFSSNRSQNLVPRHP
jgi:hypothetical protein